MVGRVEIVALDLRVGALVLVAVLLLVTVLQLRPGFCRVAVFIVPLRSRTLRSIAMVMSVEVVLAWSNVMLRLFVYFSVKCADREFLD